MGNYKQNDVRLHHSYQNLGAQHRDMRNRIRHTDISWTLQRECVKKGIRTGYCYLATR